MLDMNVVQLVVRGVSTTYTSTVGKLVASVCEMMLPDALHVNTSIYTLKSVDGGTHYEVVKTWVSTGLTFEGKTEILTGLESGTVVVDKGSRSVRTGQNVVIG